MNFYERINKKNVRVPDHFDMTCTQINDLNRNAPSRWDLIICAFKFGYMQGIRAERAGKAVL